eukprot:21986-Hanusia_phi.AAC.1
MKLQSAMVQSDQRQFGDGDCNSGTGTLIPELRTREVRTPEVCAGRGGAAGRVRSLPAGRPRAGKKK